ncbi:MAG: nucleotide-binding protein [Desulfobacula sp.]|jgi:predicted  nucleic acid-binding Zn-ribbon protein|uniref:zinc ribbon domain-containing protein n=1 Tax=Desulfobacula sp. TaxID=2593537 RepID=UPI001D3D0EC0|nr:nucleotide-binding protein [Desulfobacula sp.]MBT3485430.1 nucleotide-binding protein [Desulfobacula sp.]MBT3805573.1 nucleotide-binding protein [Desulfobacula sp.]MBT4026069.1 nucleotide-binding protein [Desulfobacula sp.]MBT4199983.1 nucleotide-binding protein [Desulfobacula sp.]
MNDFPAKSDIEILVKLQEAETQIVRLKAVLIKVEKEKEKLRATLNQFEYGVEENKEKLLRTMAACRDTEREIQVIDDRIIKSNEKLRMVKTNKEYNLFLREVDDNKKRKDVLETELLELLDENESMEKFSLESEKEFQLLKDKIEAEQKEIEKKTLDDRELLDEYLANQRKIGKTITTSVMNKFVKISKMNNGSAVVGVENEVCLGCFMNIPPQLYIEVQRGHSLISCPQCSRILYHINT